MMASSTKKWSLLASLMQILSLVAHGEAEECPAPEGGSDRELQYLFTHQILHEDYPRCRSLDFDDQRLVCEVWDSSDKDGLRRTCGAGQHSVHRRRGCPDGSRNQTCVPIDDGSAYVCACHSLKQFTTCTTSYRWDSEWRDTASLQQGLFRQLCDPDTLSCPVTEYWFGVAYLAKYIQLPDDRITASSVINSNHAPERVKIYSYFDAPCCFSTLLEDPEKWVQFDLIEPYVGLGVLIRERCEYDFGVQRPTKVDITYSPDASSWETAASDVTPVYGKSVSYSYESCIHWFEQPHTARYWKIYTRDWLGFPCLKADILGKI